MKLIKSNTILTQHIIISSSLPWGSEANSLVKFQKGLDFYMGTRNTHS